MADLNEYCTQGPRHEFEETLDAASKERETFVMGLRQLAGMDAPSTIWDTQHEGLKRLEKDGLLVIENQHIRLSEEALFVSDSVFSELV